MRLEEALKRYAPNVSEKALREIVRLDLLALPVRWNHRLRTSLGKCRGKRNRLTGEAWVTGIELNPRLLQESPEELADTLLHEVAHAAVGLAAKHGPRWQRMARLLGARPQATTAGIEMQTIAKQSPMKVVAACERCGFEVKRRRRLAQSKEYSHRGCGGTLIKR